MSRPFSLRALVVVAIFAFIVPPAIAWMRSPYWGEHIQIDYLGRDEWRVFTFPNGPQLRIHHPKSTNFWKKWPIQVRGQDADYD